MAENNQDLKSFASEALFKSKDEVSQDKEIIEKIKEKIIIIRETNQIEVTFSDNRPLVRIPLYLIGKFIACKILEIVKDPSANIEELSQKLNLPVAALSRPIGILLKDIIEKTDVGYKIRAFKILDFLNSLEDTGEGKKIEKNNKTNTRKETQITKTDTELKLKENGLKPLVEFLNISEEQLRRIIFFRENDIRIIDPKLVNKENTKEIQLDYSLTYLLCLKYSFGIERCPASFLRNKLKLLGVDSLTNLTTNLHKFPQYILHEAGKKGSTDNYFLITTPGENRVKEKFLTYTGGINNAN